MGRSRPTDPPMEKVGKLEKVGKDLKHLRTYKIHWKNNVFPYVFIVCSMNVIKTVGFSNILHFFLVFPIFPVEDPWPGWMASGTLNYRLSQTSLSQSSFVVDENPLCLLPPQQIFLIQFLFKVDGNPL